MCVCVCVCVCVHHPPSSVTSLLNSSTSGRCVCVCVCFLSCVGLCEPTGCSPASFVHGISQARSSHKQMDIPSHKPPSHPLHLIPLGNHRALGWVSCVTQQLPTSSFTYDNIYISRLRSQFVPLSPSPAESTSPLSRLCFYLIHDLFLLFLSSRLRVLRCFLLWQNIYNIKFAM